MWAISAEGFCQHRFPASSNPEVYAAQKTLVEAWRVVAESYVDDHFGGHDWPQACTLHKQSQIDATRAPQHQFRAAYLLRPALAITELSA